MNLDVRHGHVICATNMYKYVKAPVDDDDAKAKRSEAYPGRVKRFRRRSRRRGRSRIAWWQPQSVAIRAFRRGAILTNEARPRNLIGAPTKYYWCANEILLVRQRNLIGAPTKSDWCAHEI